RGRGGAFTWRNAQPNGDPTNQCARCWRARMAAPGRRATIEQAELSRAGSYGIPVVSERRFLEWIGKAVPDSLNRTYSAGQIATLSKLSRGTIEDLVRFGLLNPRGGLFGFRDLASARQVSSPAAMRSEREKNG